MLQFFLKDDVHFVFRNISLFQHDAGSSQRGRAPPRARAPPPLTHEDQ